MIKILAKTRHCRLIPAGGKRRTPVPYWLVPQLLVATAIALAPSQLWLREPLWHLNPKQQMFLGGLAVTHMLAAVIAWFTGRAAPRWQHALLGIVAAYLLFCGYFLAFDVDSGFFWTGRIFLASLIATCSMFAAALFASRPGRFAVFLGLLAVVGTLVVWPLSFGEQGKPRLERRSIATTFYPIRVVIQPRLLPHSEKVGGAVQAVEGGLLVASPDGDVMYVEARRPEQGYVSRLVGRVSLNHRKYRADLRKLLPQDHKRAQFVNFRLLDLLAQQSGQDIRIFVSHHYWKSETACFFIRVSTAVLDRRTLNSGGDVLAWRDLYDTEPCVSLDNHNLDVSGGHMALLDEKTLLLTTGDHSGEPSSSQDPGADYGKTLALNIDSGAAEIFTSGNRNAQGIVVTANGRIWETEHGPKGGDELNLLERGANYGWPHVTYGTAYAEYVWPLSNDQGRHTGFAIPIFSWLPSIGVSSLLEVQSELFPLWRGDLLVASLRAQTLFRMRLEENHVVYAEPIRIGRRIRDVSETPDGRIFLLFDDGALGWLEPESEHSQPSGVEYGGASSGQLAFEACKRCHIIGNGQDHQLGPDLKGIVGRRIGSENGFAYSAALRSVSGRWTGERLTQFLSNPQQFAPGTTMRETGLEDQRQIEDVVDFLAGHQ